MKAFTIRSCWIAKTRGRCCCTVPKNRPAPVTCPAYCCPGTRRYRQTCAATCATNCPSTVFSWSIRSRWFRTIAVPPSTRCTTPRIQQSTRRRATASIPCCTTVINKPKSIATNRISSTATPHTYCNL